MAEIVSAAANVPVLGEDTDETLSAEEEAQRDLLLGKEPATPERAAAPEQAAEEQEAEAPEEAAEAPEAAEGKPKDIRIPLSEVLKERERRKEAEQRMTEMQEKLARGDERLRMIQEELARREQAQQRQEPQANVEPDKELDPFAWYEWKMAEQDRQMQALQERYGQNAQQVQAMQMADRIRSQEAEFAAQEPSYFPAVQKLAGHLDAMFTPMFPDQSERQYAIAYWTQVAVQRAGQLGKNPAQLTYEIAKSVGLTEQEAQSAAQEVQQGAPVQAPAQPVVPAKAKAAARTLSNVGGTAPKPSLKMEDLAEMSEEEWEAFREKNSMGGLFGVR